jgi:hypothetical protein
MPIFDNCVIQAPDGTALSRCGMKKIRWYLRYGMADIVADTPTTIRLRFEPSGRDGLDDPLLLQGKPNICVACGTPDDLTRHHIVPYSFIRYMKVEYKVDVMKDIYPLCRSCHEDYERKSLVKREELAARYGVPMHGIGPVEMKRVRIAMSAASALVKHSKKIPESRRTELLQIVSEFVGKEHVTEEDLREVSHHKICDRDDYRKMSQWVAEHINSYDEFAKEWREHFVESMKPRHMPEEWKIDRKVGHVWVPDRLLKQHHQAHNTSRQSYSGKK